MLMSRSELIEAQRSTFKALEDVRAEITELDDAIGDKARQITDELIHVDTLKRAYQGLVGHRERLREELDELEISAKCIDERLSSYDFAGEFLSVLDRDGFEVCGFESDELFELYCDWCEDEEVQRLVRDDFSKFVEESTGLSECVVIKHVRHCDGSKETVREVRWMR